MVAGLLMASSTMAMAGKKVVVMDFQGPSSNSVRAAVVRSLQGNHVVVPRRTLMAEAKKMGFSTQCDANIISGVASVVGAEAVLCGTIARGSLLTLRVYNGGDGKVVRRVRVRLGREGANARTLGGIIQKIEPALAKTWNWDAVEVKGKQTSAPAPRVATADPVDELTETNAVATMPEDNAWESKDEENPLAARPAARAAAPVVHARPTAPRRAEGEHALHLSVGPAMLLRRNFATYHDSPDTVAPGWQTTPVAGIAFEAEVFPGTWFTNGLLTHVGLGIEYSRYFGLSWRNASDKQDHAATHQVFSADLRGRYGFTFGERRLSFMARAGFRHLSFSMNDTSESKAVIPDVTFNSLDLGAVASFTVLPRWLTVSAHFDYLPVFGRGEIVTFDEFGPGGGGGMRFGGGLSGNVSGGFGWKVALDYARYAIRFDRHPEARRTGEQATVARDRYMSGALFVTYKN